MSADDDDGPLEKIMFELPNDEFGAESMWARPLGEDLFEVRNVPFHAYGVNFRDVVEAWSERPDHKPVARRIVRQSGHQTLRVVFLDDSPSPDERIAMLESLGRWGVMFEGATDSFFALDVDPEGDFAAVRKELDRWEAQALLSYETCETREVGSFGDAPHDEED